METKPTDITHLKPSVRDILAIERTILASERTFLAYSRTSLALVIAGLSFFEFADSLLLKVVALFFIPMGVIVFIFGLSRFNKKKKAIRNDKYLLQFPGE